MGKQDVGVWRDVGAPDVLVLGVLERGQTMLGRVRRAVNVDGSIADTQRDRCIL